MLLTRILLICVLGLIAITVSKHTSFSRRTTIVASTVLILVITTISSIYPFENAFYSFSTPEKAFSYAQSGKVLDVVEGQKSCMVVYQDASGYDTWLAPKGDTGYKLPGFYETKTHRLQMTFLGDTSVFVKQINGDFYFQTGFVYSANPVITDASGKSIPVHTDVLSDESKVFVFAYDYTTVPIETYSIFIDNEQFSFQ